MAGCGKPASLLIIASLLLTASVAQPNVCTISSTLTNLLRQAGVNEVNARTYEKILSSQGVDAGVLKKLSVAKIRDLGIHSFGDAVKIFQFFSEDTGDNCSYVNPCNGGICIDDYKCYRCDCSLLLGGFGARCEHKCPCRNGGRCKSGVRPVQCECAPGFSGALCELRWLTETRFTALEKKVHYLESRLGKAEKLIVEASRSKFRLVRVSAVFPSFQKFLLHDVKPTYINRLPIAPPKYTKAVIISVFCFFWNRSGHAYLNFRAFQKGNEKAGKLSTDNTHFNVYANTWYYEYFVPWDTALSDEMVFEVTRTYFSGGPHNWYQIKLVGFIEA